MMKYKSNIIGAFVSLGILTAFIIVFNKLDLAHKLDLNGIIQYVSSKGKFGQVTFLLLWIVKPLFMVIPSSVFSIAGGTLFGPLQGFILNMIGFFLSGTFAFYISRLLGKRYIERIIKGNMLKIYKGIEKDGFKIIFLFRFPPIFPYDIFSITAGITRIKYRSFIFGSLLGVIPETICYSFVGNSIESGSLLRLLLSVLSMLIVMLITICFFSRMKNAVSIDEEEKVEI